MENGNEKTEYDFHNKDEKYENGSLQINKLEGDDEYEIIIHFYELNVYYKGPINYL